MYYYKTIKSDGALASLQSCSENISAIDNMLIPISQEEFDTLSAAASMRVAEEERLLEEAITAEQERIENLEKENAALLYQILTGEEFADV